MRSYCWVLVVFLFSISGFGQTYKDEISNDFGKYLKLVEEREFEKSMDYLLPEFFDIYPRDMVVKMMISVFNIPNVEIEMKDSKIIAVSDRRETKGKFYAVMDYSNQLNMRIKVDKKETSDEKKLRVLGALLGLEDKFGKEHVKYNEETDFFEILAIKKGVAVSTDGDVNWKFLTVEERQLPLLEKLLPKAILTKLF